MIADLKPYPTMKDSGVPWLEQGSSEHWEMLRGKLAVPMHQRAGQHTERKKS